MRILLSYFLFNGMEMLRLFYINIILFLFLSFLTNQPENALVINLITTVSFSNDQTLAFRLTLFEDKI